jgi:tetratricopeptide (TPR) repeat protein
MTQTVSLNNGHRLSSGRIATLLFPMSVRVKIDGEDVKFKGGAFVTKKQIKLPPDTYDIQWEQSGYHYTFVYEGSGTLRVEPGQTYEIKTDKRLGYTRLTGTSINYKHTESVVLDHATWIENKKTKEMLVGRKLLKWDPVSSSYYSLAAAYYEKGEYGYASRQYREALRYSPDHVMILNGFAWLLATCKDESFRDPASAIEYAKKASELTYFKIPGFMDTLAVAYAANGDFVEAQKYTRKAIELARAKKDHGVVGMLLSRLELFENNKPYIDITRGTGNGTKTK